MFSNEFLEMVEKQMLAVGKPVPPVLYMKAKHCLHSLLLSERTCWNVTGPLLNSSLLLHARCMLGALTILKRRYFLYIISSRMNLLKG